MSTITETTPAERIDTVAAELSLTMETKFIPWSQSRNKAEKSPSLNWAVTIKRNGRNVLTTDYSAGCAHAPSYKQGDNSMMRHDMVQFECEHGYRATSYSSGRIAQASNRPIQPELRDVLYSLAMDAEVLDAGDFEEWAGNLGYDTDSRKAETIYRACLNIALKLRNGLGEDGLSKLREACQDY